MNDNENAPMARGAHETTTLPENITTYAGGQPIITTALTCLMHGFSVIPVGTDKQPLLSSWKPFQNMPMTPEEVEQHFPESATRLAIICGQVSGNLECLDFDDPDTYAPFLELVEQQSPGLSARLLQRRTPSGGYHLIYRSAGPVTGSLKLALDQERKVRIETRGEGGYFVSAPSPGYEVLAGELSDCPELKVEEVAILHASAKAFDQLSPKERKAIGGNQVPPPEFDLNVPDLLVKHGWKEARPTTAGQGWTRPGKNSGVSGVLLASTGNFYIFSSNASPLEPRRSYTAWGLYAEYETGGDFAKAKAQLKEAGTQDTDPKREPRKTFIYGGGKFSLEADGVYFIGRNKDGEELAPQWICSPLQIVAKTRSTESREWGRLLKWNDDDGVSHQWAMPMELLQGDGNDVRRELARLGLSLSTNYSVRHLLATYLQVWPVAANALCVDRPGWHGLIYVTPAEAIAGEERDLVVFQTTHSLSHAWSTSGTVADWRGTVSQMAIGNTRVVFSLSAAFAGPLLSLAGEESGGFHFVGKSSCGKSTTAKVAASVWGNPDKYRRQWRGTDNGFEGLAALHNDGLLILDEIGQADERKVGEAAYMFANGQGKQRASRNGAARSVASWRVLLLSNGEQPLSAIMAKAGRRINAGQEVRLVHIYSDAGANLGIFEKIHSAASPGDFAKQLDELSCKYYGTVGIEWLQQLVARHKKLAPWIADRIKQFCDAVVPASASGQVERVARKFGVVAAAGELATEYGLTGWPPGEAETAARKCFESWLESFGGVGNHEEAAIVAQVRAFLEAHGSSRFEEIGSEFTQRVVNRAGFWEGNKNGERDFLVMRESFLREVCQGFDQKTVKEVLIREKMLIPAKDGRPAQQRRLPGLGNQRVYVLTYPAPLDKAEDPGQE